MTSFWVTPSTSEDVAKAPWLVARRSEILSIEGIQKNIAPSLT